MGKNRRIAPLLKLTHNLTPLMRAAICADELCDMNIFVEVLTVLAIASSVLQVFLLTLCLLESGSSEDRQYFFFPARKITITNAEKNLIILVILRKQKIQENNL